MARHQISIDEVRSRLSYDPLTGIFVWKDGRRIGKQAGYLHHSGYRVIRFGPSPYLAHRIAWVYMTGRWPRLSIDHIDMNKANNAFRNLREAAPWQNNANVGGRGALSKGVTLHRRSGKYQAQIKLRGQSFYLGLFETEAQASAAYVGASKVLFGEFARAA